jgi:hypothetical protein
MVVRGKKSLAKVQLELEPHAAAVAGAAVRGCMLRLQSSPRPPIPEWERLSTDGKRLGLGERAVVSVSRQPQQQQDDVRTARRPGSVAGKKGGALLWAWAEEGHTCLSKPERYFFSDFARPLARSLESI